MTDQELLNRIEKVDRIHKNHREFYEIAEKYGKERNKS